MKKTDYKGKTKTRSLINTILYRIKLEMPKQKLSKKDVDYFVFISKSFWRKVIEDRVFLKNGLTWDSPRGTILNFKDWVNELNREIYDLVENNYETTPTRLTSYDAYNRMRDVIEILATYGLNYKIQNLSEKLHKVSFTIIPKDHSQLNYLTYKNIKEKSELHNLIYKEFHNPRYEVKGVHLSLPTDQESEEHLKSIENRTIKYVIRAEENENFRTFYHLSKEFYYVPPWVVILNEILGDFGRKKDEKQLKKIRQFLYDMDLAIIYAISKSEEIDVLLFKLKINHYAELPELSSFELDAPPASHFYYEDTNVFDKLDKKNKKQKKIVQQIEKQLNDKRKKIMKNMEDAFRGR
jgi:hypothetical protein